MKEINEFLWLAKEKKMRKNWTEAIYYLNIAVQNLPDNEESFGKLGVTKKDLEALWGEAYEKTGHKIIPKIPWGEIPQRIETLKRFLKSAEERIEEGKMDAAIPLIETVINGVGRPGISYKSIETTEEHVLGLLRCARGSQQDIA